MRLPVSRGPLVRRYKGFEQGLSAWLRFCIRPLRRSLSLPPRPLLQLPQPHPRLPRIALPAGIRRPPQSRIVIRRHRVAEPPQVDIVQHLDGAALVEGVWCLSRQPEWMVRRQHHASHARPYVAHGRPHRAESRHRPHGERMAVMGSKAARQPRALLSRRGSTSPILKAGRRRGSNLRRITDQPPTPTPTCGAIRARTSS